MMIFSKGELDTPNSRIVKHPYGRREVTGRFGIMTLTFLKTKSSEKTFNILALFCIFF